jgi:bifunctional DNA-binding transcriptional regulator/antitoxin component of YhaV-PrlF toxin-antitoxin module
MAKENNRHGITAVGVDNRTTIPKSVMKLLKAEKGDHLIWSERGGEIVVSKLTFTIKK